MTIYSSISQLNKKFHKIALLVFVAVLSLTVIAPVAYADTRPITGTPATVSADALPTVQIDGIVWAQTIVGNTVYATGKFTTARPAGVALGGAGSVTRTNLLAYDITTGQLSTSFVHSLTGTGTVEGRSIAASPDGKKLYVGGRFAAVDGQARSNFAVFDTATGALLPGYGGPNGAVYSITSTNTMVYIGGAFSIIGGQARTDLAAYNTSGALVAGWKPTTNGMVRAMTMSPDKTKVIIGGTFSQMNGQTYYGMGALNPTTGASLPWASQSSTYPIQDVDPVNSSASITSLTANASLIFVTAFNFISSSQFGSFEGTAAISPANGNIVWLNNCHGDTYSAIPIGSVLYSVSHAHDCEPAGGFPEGSAKPSGSGNALAQSITQNGVNGPATNGYFSFQGIPRSTLLQWYPAFTIGSVSGANQAAWSVTGNSQYISLGGEFPRVNGTAQQGLVRFGTSTAAPNKRGPVAYSGGVVSNGPVLANGKNVVSVPATWDQDNESLIYKFYRDGGTTPVNTQTVNSTFWKKPTIIFQDSGLVPGSSHTYRVVVSDPFGNTTTGTTRPSTGCHTAFNIVSTLCATGETLNIQQTITSGNGIYTLMMQPDGNLVIYKAGAGAIWSTGTFGRGLAKFVVQTDGNLVIYSYGGGGAIWNAASHGKNGYALVMQDDGNLVMYTSAGQPIWYSGTAGL